MENSSVSSVENSSVENLSLSFKKLRMGTSRFNNNGVGSPLGNDSVAPPDGSCQQVEIAAKTSIENPIPAPIPLYSHKIWAARSSSNTGDAMSANSGFVAPSTSNNSFGDNATYWSEGVRDCMLNNHYNLNLYGGIVSQNSSVVPQLPSGYGIHNGTGNSSGFSNQQNLNIAGFLGENFFDSLPSNEFILLARNQTGSMYLQQMLISKDPGVTQKILEGILDSIFELMTDPYGCYLFGMLIDSCSDSQLQQIVEKITLQFEPFNDATKNKCGSISIKNLIRVLQKSPLIFKVLLVLYKGFYEIMTDRVGCNVVLKCLDLLDTQTNEILYQAAIEHCLELATHEQGCLYFNNFINNMKGMYRDKILDLISTHSVYLSQDPVGNYVMQHVLKLHNPTFTKKICFKLKGHYISLSLQKCGSHVVEMCLKSEWVDLVIEDFLKSNHLLQVARNQYGNFVIQCALKITKQTNSPFHQNLLMKLQPYHHSLQTGPGRHVLKLIRSWVNDA